ncbi:hypothetical protein D3C72_1837420 [compost metagenome]
MLGGAQDGLDGPVIGHEIGEAERRHPVVAHIDLQAAVGARSGEDGVVGLRQDAGHAGGDDQRPLADGFGGGVLGECGARQGQDAGGGQECGGGLHRYQSPTIAGSREGPASMSKTPSHAPCSNALIQRKHQETRKKSLPDRGQRG